MDTRREFLKKASMLAGGTTLWNSLPASIQKAIAINPDPGTTFEDAEHVVFLMQENRSFDHCFGTLQGVRGFNDPRFITLPDKNPVWLQTDAEGKTYPPFRLNMKDTKVTWIGGLPHGWSDQTDARNHGKYDQWLIAKKFGNKEYKGFPMTMGHYTRADIPFNYALADAFTVCDQNFCSSLTGTTPNRTFFWTGKIRPEPGAIAQVRNSDLYYNRESHWKTFPERLQDNGISWRVYQNELSLQSDLDDDADSWLSNFTDNNLEWFSQYHVRFHKAHYEFLQKRTNELPSEINQIRDQLKKTKKNLAQKIEKKLVQKQQQLEKYKSELLTWSPENFEKLSDYEKNLHKNAFTTNVNEADFHKMEIFSYEDNGTERKISLPKGDVLHQFRDDVNNGKLPTVSWLVAPQYFSDHPSAPWFGAWYVSEVFDILTKNPEVWKKTIFILNYDENDGYFDHIPPFVAPKPNDDNSGKVSDGIDTADDYVTMKEELSRKDLEKDDAREGPVGLGFRVPMIIASPWSRGGWVNSQVFDHTSTLRFLEKFLSKKTGKEIRESNISDWRRVVSGDLTSTFRPYNGEQITLPTFLEYDPFVKEIYNAKFKKNPSGYKALTEAEINEIKSNPFTSSLLPAQEKGIRNSCALPYQLIVDGQLSNDKKKYQISFAAGNELFSQTSAGAPFNVYALNKYAVNQQINANPVFENPGNWNYAVKAGSELKGEWPLDHFENGLYHLKVHGPNGFFREFSGDKNDPDVNIQLKYEEMKNTPQKCSGNIVLLFKNNGKENQTIEITDNSYKEGKQTFVLNKMETKEIVVNLKKSFNWYDISVRVKDSSMFEKRFAGRVETGEPGKSDPLMGRILI